ncbi:hypothetical protein AB0O64_37870 [Streptomyces sp. NPDC088341]|uniref:hypothetical protein n=1 Tax=Streptomyces sp. NPDC088341 TaxID=3154870 RepID=UPI0034273EDB
MTAPTADEPADLIRCTGCGVAPDDWHRSRCLVIYGRYHALALLFGLLLTLG